MTLVIRLLGIPEVICGGNPVHFKTNKALALLAYLAVEQKRLSREFLISLLWPDSNENLGRASFRNALAHLRTELGPFANQCLITQEDTVALSLPPEVEFDVRSLLEANRSLSVTKNQIPLSEPVNLENQIAALEQPVKHYSGDFLSGIAFGGSSEFEDWILVERENLHRKYAEILAGLFDLQFSSGQKIPAVDTARRWLDLDPYSDEACRSLMQAYNAMGEKSGALRNFEQFKIRLDREMNVAPEPETEALAQQLQRDTASVPIREMDQNAPVSSSFPFPFVGRAQEFNQLVTSYYETVRNGSRIIAIIGEAGIGKTRLVQEFLQWAETQKSEILFGSAWEGGNRVPYQPIVESLRSRLDNESMFSELLDKVWLAELTRLLPEIRTKINDLPQPVTDETTARQALFEAVTQLAGALARDGALVWVLEDLHWSDVASMDLLSYGLRSWTRHKLPILMIVTVREEALDDIPNLKGWLAALSRDVPIVPIELVSLKQKDISTFVEQLKDPLAISADEKTSIEQISAWLWEETGGQPLLLTETMKMHLEKGSPPRPFGQKELSSLRDPFTATRDYDAQGFTSGISRIVLWRMSRLSPIASDLARAAAILGHQFPFNMLVRVAEIPEEKALPALEELINGRILQVNSEAGESGNILYGFIHGKVKAVVQAGIPQALEFVLHRRAFHVLQEFGALPADLAYHARKSNQVEQAFRYSLLAGNNALELFDPRDAIYYYERARKLLDERLGPTLLKTILPVNLIEQLYIKLSLAYEIITEWNNAREIYATLLNIAKETHQRELEWTALNRLAILSAQHSFNVAEAMHFVEQALVVAEQTGDPLMIAETEWNLTQMANFSWLPDLAIQHGERALTMARQLESPELTARIHYALGDALSFAGRWEECIHHLEEALSIYTSLDQNIISNKPFPAQYVWAGLPPSEIMNVQAMQAACMSQLAEGYTHIGKLQEGILTARQALDIGIAMNNDWTKAMSCLILCNGLIEAGLYEEAYHIGQAGVTSASKVSNPGLLLFTKSIFGLACQMLYRFDEAQKQLLEANEMVADLPSRSYQSFCISKLCANAIKQENWDEAYRYACQSIENRRNTPTLLIFMDLLRHYEIDALLRHGDIEGARQEINQFGERVGSNRRYLVSYYICCATLDFGLTHFKEATEYVLKAIELAEQIGLTGELWQMYKMLGQIYEFDGQDSIAAQSYERAQTGIAEVASHISDPALKQLFVESAMKRKIASKFLTG